jgi:hypothetical protein
MFEDEQNTDDEITTEELTDLAFGMFTIFTERHLEAEGTYLFSEVQAGRDLASVCSALIPDFEGIYPMLAEPLAMFGSPVDIAAFYQYGEGIIPTKTTHSYWIQQSKPGIVSDAVGLEQAGKWLIFIEPSLVDEAWIKVRNATVAGELGIGAKVSTSKENNDSRDDRKVIYIFTANWADEADVMRVREGLKRLGFTDRIGYKRNLDTYAGEYREKGKRVTYYSV